MDAKPRKGSRAKSVLGSIGVGINGVQLRPSTADYFDANSRRKMSRNSRSGWRYEGKGPVNRFGLDRNNAHVDRRGLYHYHGVANALVRSSGSSLIGWAADGFEIHYVGSRAKPSYRLKSGTRPSGPGGKYDGTFVQDYQYVSGVGNLDRCNGGLLSGRYVYFATDKFPYLPRCLWGRVSRDFAHGRAAAQRPERRKSRRRPDRESAGNRHERQRGFGSDDRRRPPRVAVLACKNKSQGHKCTFTGRGQRSIRGICRDVQSNLLACAPRRGIARP